MGGAVGSITKNFKDVTNGLNLSMPMQQAMEQIARSGDQRAAFNAILLATAANVSKKPNFNLELEINDLWTRLGNLRNAAPAVGGLPATGLPQIFGQLSSVVTHLEAAMKSLVNNAR